MKHFLKIFSILTLSMLLGNFSAFAEDCHRGGTSFTTKENLQQPSWRPSHAHAHEKTGKKTLH